MNAIKAKLRAIGLEWGARLNALQAVLVAAIIANASSLQSAIAAIVPAKYQGAAGLIAGVTAYVIVEAARSSDAKKILNGGR